MRFYFCALAVALFVSAPAHAETYEIGYSHYDGMGTKMRQETVFRIDDVGLRKAIQTRIYVDDTNELREASFLQKNGKWALYGDTNLPASLKAQINLANKLAKNRILVTEHPRTPEDASVKPGALGDPVMVSSSQDSKTACEMTSPEFVTCNGVVYRRESGGNFIQSIWGKIKSTVGSSSTGSEPIGTRSVKSAN